MNTEIWKQIDGFPNYLVSSEGRVKNTDGRIIKPYVNHKGYFKLELYRNGIGYKKRVHRLVAQAFISNVKNLPEVNHRNLNKQDNRVDNLEWVTDEENRQHYLNIKRRFNYVT